MTAGETVALSNYEEETATHFEIQDSFPGLEHLLSSPSINQPQEPLFVLDNFVEHG